MIHLVVALPAEARPLASHFSLRSAAEGSPFRIYEGEEISLIVSGIGKTAAAAAVAYQFARSGELRNRAWLNVGIAGHRARPVGEPLVAHKVVDEGSGRSWFPPAVFERPCESGVVRTVDRVEREYPADAAYDMEASGFCASASRLATSELVQVLKVVSDNRSRGPDGISPGEVEALVEGRLETVDRLVAACAALARELDERQAEPPAFPELSRRWRFTVSERRLLRRLLRRLATLDPEGEPLLEAVAPARSGEQALKILQERLDSRAVGWS